MNVDNKNTLMIGRLNPPFHELDELYRNYKTLNHMDKAKLLFEILFPLICSMQELANLRTSWISNAKISRYYQLEKKALEILKQLATKLKKNPTIWQKLQDKTCPHNPNSIKALIVVNPIQAFFDFKNLCELIMGFGEGHLIEKYVNFRTIQKYIPDQTTNEMKLSNLQIIDSYKTNLSIYQLCERKRALLHEPITAFNVLNFGMKLWNAIEYSETELDSKEFLLGKIPLPILFFNHALQEFIVLKIEKRKTRFTGTFFLEEVLDKHLDLLMIGIFRFQKFGHIDPTSHNKPTSLTISMPEDKILLDLNWSTNCNTYILKEFNDPDDNDLYKDAKNVFSAEDGKFTQLEGSGANGKKFLERTFVETPVLGKHFLKTKTKSVAIKSRILTSGQIKDEDWPIIYAEIGLKSSNAS